MNEKLSIPELVARVNSPLPEDFRAEQSVLAVAIAAFEDANKAAKEKILALPAEIFFTPLHRSIFETAQRIFSTTSDVEWQAVARIMPDHHNDIALLSTEVVVPSSLAYYVERLKTCLAKRRIYEAGLKTAVDALSIAPEAPDPAALVGSAVESFASIQSGTEREAVTLRQAFLEMADVIGQPKQLGLATPFRRLNDVTPGFKPGKYWLISGGPSDGKSAMAQNLSSCMLNADIPHTYYSAELTVEELTQRYLAINCNVSLNLWEKLDTEITHEDHIALANSSRWNGLDLLNIVDAVGWTVDQVCIHMAEMAAQGHKAAVIDYLALLELEYLAPKMREQQVARASQKLQRAAKKTGMTVFVLSQLNDDGQVRESRAPHQDCDVHIRMEKVTEKGPDGEPREATDKRKMRIMKSRQGKRGGLFYFQFVGEFQRFYEIQYTEEPLPEKGRTWKTRK